MGYDDNYKYYIIYSGILTVSHYHKVYIHVIVFISDLETDHS